MEQLNSQMEKQTLSAISTPATSPSISYYQINHVDSLIPQPLASPTFNTPSLTQRSTSLTQRLLPSLAYSSHTKRKSHMGSRPPVEVAGMSHSRRISHSCRNFRSWLARAQA